MIYSNTSKPLQMAALVAILSTLTAFGAAQSLTLEQALTLARNNLAYQAKLQRLEAFRQKILQSDRRPNPTLESEFETAVNQKDHSFSVALLQPWERGGKRQLRKSIAESELQEAEFEAQNTLRVIRSETHATYLNLLMFQKQLSLLGEQETRLKALQNYDQVRLDQGEIAPLNLEYLATELDQVEVRRRDLLVQQKHTGHHLNTLMGIPDEPDHVLVEVQGVDSLPPLDQFIEFAVRSRPDLLRMRAARKTSTLQVSVEKAKAKQDWVVGLGYHRFNTRLDFDSFRPLGVLDSVRDVTNLLEVSLRVPLPLWDDNSGNIGAALAIESAVQRETSGIESIIRHEVAAAYGDVETRRNMSTFYQQDLIPRLEDTWSRAEAAYKLTGQDVLDVLAKSRERMVAGLMGSASSYALHKAIAKLEEEVGGTLEQVERSGLGGTN